MLSAKKSAAPSDDALYVENVFSTYLYDGSGASKTITNGIDLSGKGGMVWVKSRSAATDNFLFDTARGALYEINSNKTDASTSLANSLTAFNSDGFSISSATGIGVNAATYASWTFRKAAKFFDVVTYTGNGANRTINHSLGSVPGCIMVKRTDTTGDWQVYHRSLANTEYLVLNTTAAKATGATRWNSTTATSTVFSLGTEATVNANGGTYVAYLFAHDAGGFGDSGTDSVISCGSYVGDGTTTKIVSLGYEPQWILLHNTIGSSNWFLFDTMRGMDFADDYQLLANLSDAEARYALSIVAPTATGFTFPGSAAYFNTLNESWIYIAIRRGPMKTPTSGTSVFAPVTRTAPSTAVTSNTNPDLLIAANRTGTHSKAWLDKLRGFIAYLASTNTGTEYSGATATLTGWGNTGVTYNSSAGGPANDSGVTYVDYYFTRAPGFFDVVCYTGTGSARTVTHNLTVAPELIMVKRRETTGAWQIYAGDATKYLVLNTTAANATSSTRWNNTAPTSSVFSLGTQAEVNASGGTFVAYLFATVTGVSKVGTYTGTGAAQVINCGFTAGARFVLIKRTDSTGDWFVWDTARGIVSGNDPYLRLNSTAAENTGIDYIDPDNSGFEISSTAPAGINANGGTFLFFAVA